MKNMYKKPEMTIEEVTVATFVMMPPSPDGGYNPAPMRRSVAPSVPGDNL